MSGTDSQVQHEAVAKPVYIHTLIAYNSRFRISKTKSVDVRRVTGKRKRGEDDDNDDYEEPSMMHDDLIPDFDYCHPEVLAQLQSFLQKIERREVFITVDEVLHWLHLYTVAIKQTERLLHSKKKARLASS